MPDIDNISSILNAVNEINIKPKKIKSTTAIQNSIPGLNKGLKISPDINRLILEAEEYKKKSTSKFTQVSSTQSKSKVIKSKNNNQIILNLRLKIKDLEKKLENFRTRKEQVINTKKTSSKNVPFADFTNKYILKEEVINPSTTQDSIDVLKKKKIKFKNTEMALRSQIIDLDQDKTILLNKVKKFDELKNYKNDENETKEKLKSIYKQVEKQKKIFIDLKNYSTKVELDSNFFKDHYEKLIVENNENKKKLTIAKEQLDIIESNEQDV